MKKTYKYLITIALNGILCTFIALSAGAQHRDGGGSSGGGGGSRSSGGSPSGGGGSRPVASPSSNGGFRASGGFNRPSSNNFNRPSVNNAGRPVGGFMRPGNSVSRPNNGNQRIAIAPPRIANPNYGVATAHRIGVNSGSYNYGGRTTATTSIGTRGYVGQGGRTAVGVGGRGFYGPAYWRNSGYYHYHHGYYGTYYAPRLGFSIGFLPYGYYPFYYDDAEFFYSGGLFYQYDNNEYTVVEPPVGAEVNSLPSNAQSIMINGEQYFEANGVYYEPITKDDGTTSYQVAGKDGELNTNNPNGDVQQAPQIGDVVEALPANCRKINLNGEKYYVSEDGYYYQEGRDNNNNKVYKIVGTPDDAPSDQQ